MKPDCPTISDRQLDRLVDGELSDTEFRELIAQLEQTDGAWKRCALVFLQAQAWQRELPRIAQETGHPKVSAAKQRSESVQSGLRLPTVVLALAASVLVSLSVGWWSHRWIPGQSTGRSLVPVADGGQVPRPTAEPIPAIDPEVDRPRFVYVNQWDGTERTEIPVPIDASRPFDPLAVVDRTWGMPPEAIQQLQRIGHQLETHDHFIPVTLQNGNRVVVPMQEVILYPPEIPFH